MGVRSWGGILCRLAGDNLWEMIVKSLLREAVWFARGFFYLLLILTGLVLLLLLLLVFVGSYLTQLSFFFLYYVDYKAAFLVLLKEF